MKPQGSLERSKDSLVVHTESNTFENNVLPTVRKPRQNVAMQTIMRRAETEQKQVTFKNVSPLNVEEENEKRLKVSLASPTKGMSTENKNISVTAIGEISKQSNVPNLSPNPLITVQNRLPLMPFAPTTVQNQQLVNPSNQTKTSKLQHTVSQSSQMNYLSKRATNHRNSNDNIWYFTVRRNYLLPKSNV